MCYISQIIANIQGEKESERQEDFKKAEDGEKWKGTWQVPGRE